MSYESKFYEKANKKHNNRYDYSKVVYLGCNTLVTIICPEHGEFQQTPGNHLRTKGCPKCSKRAGALTRKTTMNTERFIERAKERFGDAVSYEKSIYTGNYQKLIITCPVHGDVEVTPNNYLRAKKPCPKCSTRDITTQEWIRRAKEVHGDKYDYSKAGYVDSSTLISIFCSEHGEFFQRPYDHLEGHGCIFCAVDAGYKPDRLTEANPNYDKLTTYLQNK